MEAARPSLRQNLPSLPPAAWVLFGGTFVNRLGTFVMPFMTLYLTQRGFSVPQAGLAVAMYGIGGGGGPLLGGGGGARGGGGVRRAAGGAGARDVRDRRGGRPVPGWVAGRPDRAKERDRVLDARRVGD